LYELQGGKSEELSEELSELLITLTLKATVEVLLRYMHGLDDVIPVEQNLEVVEAADYYMLDGLTRMWREMAPQLTVPELIR
jgi:hypothetical protein